MSWLSSDCIFNKRKRPKKNSANTNNNDSKKRVNLFFQYKKKLLINVIYLFNRGYITAHGASGLPELMVTMNGNIMPWS